MHRVYGPPGEASRRSGEPRVPRNVRALREASKRPRFLISVAAIGFGLLAFVALAIAIFSPPPAPALNEPGAELVTPSIAFNKPGFWVSWIPAGDLSQPMVLFAPQDDPEEAPTTISIASINVTDDYLAAVGEETTGVVTLDLLQALVAQWAAEEERGLYETEEVAYNVIDSETGLALSGLLVRWQDPIGWTPQPLGPIAGVASPTPAATLEPGVVPSASPSSTPAPSLVPVAGVGLYQWQMLGLPNTRPFSDNGQHSALVVTLTWPSTLSEERVAQAQESFLRLVGSLRLTE